MRIAWIPAFLSTLALAACGSVAVAPDGSSDGPPPSDGPPTDGPPADGPPPGPIPVIHWTLDDNVNNSGALTGYSLTTPGGISYGDGKVGRAAIFGQGQYSNVAGMRASLDTYAKVTIAFWLNVSGNPPNAILDINNRTNAPYGGIQLGISAQSVSLCVSTLSNPFLSGSCSGFNNTLGAAWHHWIIRYDGAGTAAGQGGPVQVYVDDILVHTRANDTANDPVFNTTGTPDVLSIGTAGTMFDDVRIYNQVFAPPEQCTQIIGGTWNGQSCALP